MARTEGQIKPRIVKNGGPITNLSYKSYYSSGAAGEDWEAGDWLQLRDDGTVTKSTDSSGIGTGGTNVRFIALSDHDSSAEGKSVFVPVQAITQDTVFRGQLGASSTGSTIPVQAMIGNRYDVTAINSTLVVDVDDTTNPCVEITDVEPNWNPFKSESSESYGMVEFKILPSVLETAPTS